MDNLASLKSGYPQVIGVIRTKSGEHEAATVSFLSRFLVSESEPHLIIRKQEADPLYEPMSDEFASLLSDFPEVAQQNYLRTRPECPAVNSFQAAQDFIAAQIVDDWTAYTPRRLEERHAELPKHKIILTFAGLESGATDSEFQLCNQLCDRVVLTMFKLDYCSWEAVNSWIEPFDSEERQKLLIAVWDNDKTTWTMDLLTANEFATKYEEQSASETYF